MNTRIGAGRIRSVHNRSLRIIVAAALGLALLASCATVNRLDEYQVSGSDVSTTLLPPPPPQVTASGGVDLSSENPFAIALSLATGVVREAGRQEGESVVLRAAEDRPETPTTS